MNSWENFFWNCERACDQLMNLQNKSHFPAGVQILVHRGSQEQMAEYQCACCKVPCAACESNFELEDLNETWSNEPCGPAPGGLSHSQIF